MNVSPGTRNEWLRDGSALVLDTRCERLVTFWDDVMGRRVAWRRAFPPDRRLGGSAKAKSGSWSREPDWCKTAAQFGMQGAGSGGITRPENTGGKSLQDLQNFR